MSDQPLIELTARGLTCERGGFHIDPNGPVDVAIVTHAHSDHARKGAGLYICAKAGEELLRCRLGKNINVQTLDYGEQIRLGRVLVSLHSAGHILGSSQVRVESEKQVWVASGDYKREPDPSCDPFEVVSCDTFITESTFGTPRFVWDKTVQYGEEIARWWRQNAADGFHSILFGYSLGKAQRLLCELAALAHKPILVHPTVEKLNACYRNRGRVLARTVPVQSTQNEGYLGADFVPSGELLFLPPSAAKAPWLNAFSPARTAFASGWMLDFNPAYHRFDRGFVLSDHADWPDLLQTIQETGARRVFVQHRSGSLVRRLRQNGIEAHPESALERQHFARIFMRTAELFGE